jgi:peroxiredoxin
MTELGELEAHHEDFARRNARVVVASVQNRDESAQTQADFPHLLVLADTEQNLVRAAGMLHPGAAPDGSDTAAPTMVLIDRNGRVCWLYRPAFLLDRLSPTELLAALDQHCPPSR